MRGWSSVFVGFLVVMSSCGTFPDGQTDTEGVAERTPTFAFERAENPAKDEAPVPAPPVATGPAVSQGTKVGFAAGTRFVVFVNEDEPSFAVFDRDRGETFRVLGSPMGSPQPTYDRYSEFGLSAGALQWGLQSASDGRVLVRSTCGVQLVDLAERGKMIAAWRGTPLAASVAQDGTTFAVSTTEAMHVVRASDGAIASFAGAFTEGNAVPTWGDKNVFWTVGGELKRVNRATLKASTVRANGDKPQLATSKDATVVAVAAGDTFTVYAGDDLERVMTLPAKDVDDLKVDDDGATVVWVERVIDEATFRDRGHLHAIDVAAKTHVRFAMVNSGCGNAPEILRTVADGKITTDPSCSIGCPSVRWTHRTVVYDAKNGTILEDTSVAETQSWNEQQGVLRESVDAAAKKLKVEVDAMFRQPSKEGDRFLFARNGDLVLASAAANDVLTLEASKGAWLGGLTFSSDGMLIAGTVDDRARVWDATTGRALLR